MVLFLSEIEEIQVRKGRYFNVSANYPQLLSQDYTISGAPYGELEENQRKLKKNEWNLQFLTHSYERRKVRRLSRQDFNVISQAQK